MVLKAMATLGVDMRSECGQTDTDEDYDSFCPSVTTSAFVYSSARASFTKTVAGAAFAQPFATRNVGEGAMIGELARWDVRQPCAAPTTPEPCTLGAQGSSIDGIADVSDHEERQAAFMRLVVRALQIAQIAQELTAGDEVEQTPSSCETRDRDGWNVARGVWSSSQELLTSPPPRILPHRVMTLLYPAQPYPPPAHERRQTRHQA